MIPGVGGWGDSAQTYSLSLQTPLQPPGRTQGLSSAGEFLSSPSGAFLGQRILTFSLPFYSEYSSLMAFTSQSPSVPCSESLVSLASMTSSFE